MVRWVVMPLALAAIGGCRCGKRAPAPEPPPEDTIALAVRQDDSVIDRIAIGSEPVDLWSWCDRPGITSLRADGPGGAVLGDCSQRDTQRLIARRGDDGEPVVELVRKASGAVMGRTATVTSLSLWAPRPAPEDTAPALRLEVEGAAPVELARAAIETHLSQHPRRGALLGAILAAHGVPAAALRRVVARAGDESLELPAAWFTQHGHEVRIRFNRRGRPKLVHWFEGREREQLRNLESLAVELR